MDKKYDVAICLELVFQKLTSSKMVTIWKNVGKLTMTVRSNSTFSSFTCISNDISNDRGTI
jgi:hypothetical protein